jgi:polyferredoxin
VTTPLITAGHVHAVMDLGAGREPSPWRALAAAGRRLTPVAAAVTLAAIGSALGLVLLIAPGVYLWARWFLSPQAVVAENLGPLEGLKRSADLVRGQWWRIFGIAFVISLIAALLAAALGFSLQAAGWTIENGLLVLLGQVISDAIALSFAALAGTLLFFDARARRSAPPPPPQPDLTLPERPA